MPIVRIQPGTHVAQQYQPPFPPRAVAVRVEAEHPAIVIVTTPLGLAQYRASAPTIESYAHSMAQPSFYFEFQPNVGQPWVLIIVNPANQENAVFTEASW